MGVMPLRMARRDPQTDRSTKILHIEGIALETDRLEEMVDHVGDVIERVRERLRARRGAVSEAGVIRCHEMKSIGEQR
jgi:hypothetical protein